MRGGAGRNQGRKPGSVNVQSAKTRAIIEQAAEEGILPLQVMLDNIRFYTKQANELIAKLIAEGVEEAPLIEEGEDAPEPNAGVIEAIGQVLGLRKLAGEEAARAAQYVHPRQGIAGDEHNPNEGEVPLAERLKEYQRRDDIAAAGDKVVELKR
jgi:hypothetical protein